MWGLDYLKNKQRVQKEFTILHAGTYKLLGGRVWIYETSNEFLYGIKKLVDVVNGLENVRLIIRIREEPKECDIDAIKKLLPSSSKWELSLNNSFEEDLTRCDMLVSYSSTTIEEALNYRKPVGIYGGSLRYRHIKKTHKNNLRYPIYHLTHKNLKHEILNIKDLHHNKPLSNNELDGLIWDEKIMTKEKFLKSLVS